MYDINWNLLPFKYLYKTPNFKLNKPKKLEEMIHIARELSKDLPFVRVDLYSIPKVIFGEMTFFPGVGTEPFVPHKWDLKVGKWLNLPYNKL